MNNVTRILSAIEQGDPHAAEQLLPLVYAELRQLAAQQLSQEKAGQLASVDRAAADVVRLRFFAGLKAAVAGDAELEERPKKRGQDP